MPHKVWTSGFENLHGLFTPWRLRWYPRAYLFALGAAFIIAVFTGEGASTLSGRLGGDYPAFYCAGRIIAEGNGTHLYDSGVQATMQEGLFPDEDKLFMPFRNPPFVAALYTPLSLVNYRLSYVIHTILLTAAVFLSIWLLRPIHEQIPKHYLFFVSLALSFYPLLRAVTGSQNTAVTLLLIILSWRAALARKEFLAGIITGLLLFKPQFALPLIGLYMLSGRWRVCLGATMTALLLYVASALISGPDWIAEWYNYAAWVEDTDVVINCDKSVSFTGFFQAILGCKNHIALISGWTLSLITIIFLAYIWAAGGRTADLTAQMAITAAALVLIPPHVNYYDLGIILFTCLAIAGTETGTWTPLFIAWLFGFAQPASVFFGFSLLFPVAVIVMIWSVRILYRPATQVVRTKQAFP